MEDRTYSPFNGGYSGRKSMEEIEKELDTEGYIYSSSKEAQKMLDKMPNIKSAVLKPNQDNKK